MLRSSQSTIRQTYSGATCVLAFLLCVLLFCAISTTNADESKQEIETKPVSKSPSKAPKQDASSWPLFRGNTASTGVAPGALPQRLDLLWKYQVPNGAFDATAAIDKGTVFLGDLDGTFFAFDLATGKPRWKFTGEAGFSSAGLFGSRVYVGDLEGRFYCFDAKTGEKQWTFEAEAEINGGPNFYQGNVLFGSQDARLYCLDAVSGKLVWKHEIEDQIRSFPTLVEGQVFIAGCDGWLHIIDAASGKEKDKIEIGSPTTSTPGALDNRVYFGTEGAEFLGVDLEEKKVLWRFRARRSGHGFRSSAAVSRTAIIFGGRDRRVHAVDPNNGESLWNFAARGMIDGSPVLVGDRVFVGAKDGRLYELNAKTGDKIWDYHAGGRFTASPAVAAGRLIIASEDGQVYCFGEKQTP